MEQINKPLISMTSWLLYERFAGVQVAHTGAWCVSSVIIICRRSPNIKGSFWGTKLEDGCSSGQPLKPLPLEIKLWVSESSEITCRLLSTAGSRSAPVLEDLVTDATRSVGYSRSSATSDASPGASLAVSISSPSSGEYRFSRCSSAAT